MQDVEQVEVDPLVEGDGVAVTPRLPVAGDARAHGEPQLVPERVLADLARERRARPHDRHVAREHVPELRELVERGLANELAHARDAGVVLDLEDRTVLLVVAHELFEAVLRVHVHGAELHHLEGTSAPTHALLEEERGTMRVIEPDGKRNEREHRQQNYQYARAEGNVKGALDDAVDRPAVDTTGDALELRGREATVLCLNEPQSRVLLARCGAC